MVVTGIITKTINLRRKTVFSTFYLLYRTSNRKYCKILKLHGYNPQALPKKSPVLQQVSITSTVDYRTINQLYAGQAERLIRVDELCTQTVVVLLLVISSPFSSTSTQAFKEAGASN